jgi:hypothetical protein
MSASDAEPWARLRLLQGRSPAELWELVHALGHSTLTVGAAAGCSWVVQEAGVAPVHFSLHWDGSALRIADRHGAGQLHVDGVAVSAEWRLLSGRARIDFGQAAIAVETSAGSADLGHPLDSQPAETWRKTQPSQRSGGTARPAAKATLLGVAPLTGRGTPIMATVPPHTPHSAPEALGAPEQSDSFRPERFTDRPSARAPKPTLLGIAPSPYPEHWLDPDDNCPTVVMAAPYDNCATVVVMAAPAGPHAPPQVPEAVLIGAAAGASGNPGARDRLSDAPTETRDVTQVESRRPFPWRYVGFGALTVLAYAAWLYLLDHW